MHRAGAAERHPATELRAGHATSRSTHKSGVSPSTSTLCVLPLTLMEKAMMSFLSPVVIEHDAPAPVSQPFSVHDAFANVLELRGCNVDERSGTSGERRR